MNMIRPANVAGTKAWAGVCLARLGQSGAMNILVVPLLLITVALIITGVFAFSSYGQAQDYKNNTDQKIAAAVSEAESKVSQQKDKSFAEQLKSPYVVYNGPSAYGSIRLQYPRTWSAYVDVPNSQSNSKPINGYFAPGQVPSISDPNNTFALRLTVAQQAYDSLVKQYSAKVKSGGVTVVPYKSPNIPNIVGVRIDGEIQSKKQGSMIILPFRDKTLQLWTESNDYKADFDNIILPNFSLVP